MSSIDNPTVPRPGLRVRRWMRLLGLGALAYAAVLLFLYWNQESLIFLPTRLPPDYRFDAPGVVERQVEVAGATLSALHFRQPDAKGVIFFLHGNGGSLREWFIGTDFYRRTRFDLLMLDYRGYGKSTGRITSEAQLHADVRAAFESIASEYAGRKLVLYGRSLGSGLATKLATEVPADLLVLVSPYSSVRAVAREQYPWVPMGLLRYPLRTDLWLPQVKMPVLILHGERDRVIGIEHAERLHAIKPAAEFVRLRDADHNDIHRDREYIEALVARLERL